MKEKQGDDQRLYVNILRAGREGLGTRLVSVQKYVHVAFIGAEGSVYSRKYGIYFTDLHLISTTTKLHLHTYSTMLAPISLLAAVWLLD